MKKNFGLEDLKAASDDSGESRVVIDLEKGYNNYLAEIQTLIRLVDNECREGEDPGQALNAMLLATSEFVGELIPGISVGGLVVFLGAVAGSEIGGAMHSMRANGRQQDQALSEAAMQFYTAASEAIPRARQMVEKIEEAKAREEVPGVKA